MKLDQKTIKNILIVIFLIFLICTLMAGRAFFIYWILLFFVFATIILVKKQAIALRAVVEGFPPSAGYSRSGDHQNQQCNISKAYRSIHLSSPVSRSMFWSRTGRYLSGPSSSPLRQLSRNPKSSPWKVRSEEDPGSFF